MGILGLSKLIADLVPTAIKENEIKNYFGRKVAIDASMCLYQFLIAVRSDGVQLTTVDGETTSHLMGIFYRTIRLLDNGIKPVYVFDGKPPKLKGGELQKRAERREEAQKQLDKATEAGDQEAVEKFNRRLVKVTQNHAGEAKELLKLMGVPYIEAPCEAEAQCAAMVKAGKVFATATEDMDALTFGSNILLRHLTSSEARKLPVQEINYQRVLHGLDFSEDQFIDLCILLGCDYCESIRGVGPKRAIELMTQHKTIEAVLETIDRKKYVVPEDWNFAQARQLFKQPEIQEPQSVEMKWTDPDEEGLVQFLCGHRQFNEERIRSGIQKMKKSKSMATQGRLDSFFKVLPATYAAKRKAEEPKKPDSGKKAKKSVGKVGKKK